MRLSSSHAAAFRAREREEEGGTIAFGAESS